MKITPKFGIVLANKRIEDENIQNKNTEHLSILKDNQTDTFTSTTKKYSSPVSFRGAAPNPNKILEMIKSNSYFKILGATIVATAATLWTQLKEAGVKENEITEEDITKMLTTSVDEVLKEKANNKTDIEKITSSNANEEIIEAEATPIEPAKKRGRPKGSKNKPKIKAEEIKTVKLKEEKQKAPKLVKRQTEENIKIVTELALTGQYSQIEISRMTGIPELAVSRIVRKYDLPTPKKVRKAHANVLTDEKITQTFEECKNLSKKEVARKLGLTEGHLDKLCRERGIPQFVTLKKVEQIDEATLKTHILAGLSTQEIALKEGLKTNIIRDAYKKYGIENPNRKERTILSDELIAEIKQRKLNNESNESIAQDLGLAIITVNRVTTNKNTSLVIEIKKLAEAGFTLDEIAKETNKNVATIKKLATRYKIKINGNNKNDSEIKSIDNTEVLKGKDKITLSKYLVKKYNIEITPDDLFFAFPRLEIEQTPEIQDLIASLKDDFKKDIEIINKLDYAKILKDIERIKKTQTSTVIRYTNEDLINRYLAKSYKLMLGNDNNVNRVQSFIDNTTVPRIILDKENTDFINDLWRHRDTEIPENDPLFEKYKSCFDRKAIELRVENLKSNYKKTIVEQISTYENLKNLQEANSPYFEITPQVLFNLVVGRKDCNYAKLIVPKFKTREENADHTQKELMKIISNFKKKDLAKEYIDLVNIYNQFCTENYDQNFAESFLNNLIKISQPEEINISELKDLISSYKSGTILETVTEKIDYATLSIEELKNELDEIYNKLPQNCDEELSTRILDFLVYANEEDHSKLCDFMFIIDSYLENDITLQEVLNQCRENNIKPLESGLDDWIMQNKIKSVKSSIQSKYAQLPKYLLNDSKFNTIKYDINCIDTMSYEELNDFNNILEKLILNANNSKVIEEILDEAVNNKILSGNFIPDDDLKKFALSIIGSSENISYKEALDCLNKIDKYNSLPNDKKTLVGNVLATFDNETSPLEKKIIYEIVYNKCLKEDSIIYNEAYGENVTITKELKQELLKEYKDVFILLKWFEDAAALKADLRGTPGIKDLGISNKNPRYSMEIKITNKNYAQIRLYSVFERDKDGNAIKKDKNGNRIRNFVFTKLDTDHNKIKK